MNTAEKSLTSWSRRHTDNRVCGKAGGTGRKKSCRIIIALKDESKMQARQFETAFEIG